MILGHLAEKNLFTLNTTLAEVFTNDTDWEDVSGAEEKKTITMFEILTMTSGLAEEGGFSQSEDNSLRGMLDSTKYDPDQRGTFEYLASTHMVAHLIYGLSGMTPNEYAIEEGIFAALGMTAPTDYTWETFDGLEGSAYGLRTDPRTLAKLGALYLQQGYASDDTAASPLIASDWIQRSVTNQLSDGDSSFGGADRGYGYQWYPVGDDGLFKALGLFGNQIWVFPEDNVVITITSSRGFLELSTSFLASSIVRNLDSLHESEDSCSFLLTPFVAIQEIFLFLTESFF